jgi:D-alanine-D-alanine ligase
VWAFKEDEPVMTRMIADTRETVFAEQHTMNRQIANLEVTVLAGGAGVERLVSLESGNMVRDALRRLNHHAIMLDIDASDLAALDVPADMVFVALHGQFGEDGALQRILEDRRIPFCGSGAAASALAMDKVAAKVRLLDAGIPTPDFDLIKAGRIDECVEKTSYPVVVKPRSSGSSVDISIVRDKPSLARSLNHVVETYGAALVEQFVDGLELTVGVLDGRALPVCQIVTPREFYDYQAKYHRDDTEYHFDIDLPEALLASIQQMSLRAHRCLGCRDFSRVDWMVDRKTHEPYAIEVNTIPGLTSHSLLPKAAQHDGLSFDALCQRVLELTMARTV